MNHMAQIHRFIILDIITTRQGHQFGNLSQLCASGTTITRPLPVWYYGKSVQIIKNVIIRYNKQMILCRYMCACVRHLNIRVRKYMNWCFRLPPGRLSLAPRPFKRMESKLFRYTLEWNWCFILPPGLVVWPALHIFTCCYRVQLYYTYMHACMHTYIDTYIALHYVTLRCVTLRYITLHTYQWDDHLFMSDCLLVRVYPTAATGQSTSQLSHQPPLLPATSTRSLQLSLGHFIEGFYDTQAVMNGLQSASTKE